jgi:hypothetical protein
VPKLKEYLLPHIKSILLKEAASELDTHHLQAGLVPVNHIASPGHHERDVVFLQNDHIYEHISQDSTIPPMTLEGLKTLSTLAHPTVM